MSARIRIVVAEDHDVVREGLRAVLQREPDLTIVGEAGDGVETLARVADLDPDVLLIDLEMPRLSGMDALRQLRRRGARPAVVVLSMHQEVSYVFDALEAGARAYVVKTAASEEVVDAIRRVVEGRPYLSATISEDELAQYAATQARRVPAPLLSPRQIEVIRLSAQGLSLARIAERLSISPRTVETHRQSAMRKLDLRSQTDLVRYVIREGLIPPER
jgi:DNA-binding NarL/FixJ family response regulator